MNPHRGRCQEAAALSWAVHQPGLDAFERCVLVHLVDVADPRNGHVDEPDAKVATIAAALEMGPRKVRYALDRLATLGLIRRVDRPGRTALVTVAVPGRPFVALSPTAAPRAAVDNSNRGTSCQGLSPTAARGAGVDLETTRSDELSTAAHNSFPGCTSRGGEGQAGLPGIDDLAGNRAARRRRQRAMTAAAVGQRWQRTRQVAR